MLARLLPPAVGYDKTCRFILLLVAYLENIPKAADMSFGV
jgi:hypothetical protein